MLGNGCNATLSSTMSLVKDSRRVWFLRDTGFATEGNWVGEGEGGREGKREKGAHTLRQVHLIQRLASHQGCRDHHNYSVDDRRITGFMPPACYTSIGLTAKVGEWGGGGRGGKRPY